MRQIQTLRDMADTDLQAHEFVRQHNWSRAMTIYDQLLAPATTNFKIPKDKIIACLLGRCECYLELGKYENCICDAKRVLKMLSEQTDCGASIARVRRRLIHSFYKLKRFQEAEVATKEWITEASAQPSFVDINKTLDRYKAVIQMANGHKTNSRISLARLDEEMGTLDTKLEHWATNNLPLDKYSKLLTNKGIKKRESSNGNGTQKLTDQLGNLKMNDTNENQDGSVTCSYCTMSFQDKNELRQHCQTESHQNVIMSDEGRDWKWRPPPRGYTLDSYTLCESYTESATCHYGNQCVEAHGMDELNEWKERFEYRKMRLQRAFEKELYGKTYTEELLEKWVQSTNPEKVMREKIDAVDEQCSNELVTTISSKVSKREWLFTFKTRRHLKAVALLQDAHRHHFSIKSIIPGDIKATNLSTTTSNAKKSGNTSSNNAVGSKHNEAELKSDQEWVSPTFERMISTGKDSVLLEHKVRIVFSTDIYGTFRQSVCFDFDSEPVLVKHLCVDVVPVSDAEKIQEIKNDIINSTSQRWDDTNSSVIKFETTIASHLKTEAYLNDIKREKDLLERYPCPRASTFTLTQSTIVEKRLTKNNYRSRIHELLYVEEIARYEQIARYNLSTKLRIASNYMLTPSGMATSTAKYSHSGELFGLMTLGKDISEDTSAGRLILSNCLSVYLAEALKPDEKPNKRRDVYECMIEDKGKNMIYLKLSAKCVQGLNLKPDTDFKVDIQFQLNRLSYCEWHNAVDKIADFRIIFPDTVIEPNIPWTPKKQWSDSCDPKLNTKQKEAINAITTPISVHLPPILLIGPFGTGKTYTLAQAIKQLLLQPEAKILICTHSNSAADLYIKEYLHPWVEKGMKEATPLRVYYHKRWVATVNGVVQKYCIIDGNGNFRRPTVEDILKHRIVVVTLSISMELASLDLPKGHFTHIFLDEAAQAMECEAIMPLALASEDTRIVLAGDHMQMSPELFSNFAKERKLHISLLERLYDHYPASFPCKILLCENYRAHEAIIKFTSELFYEQKLIASGKQPRHDKFYPLTFFTTRGEDVQDKNSTAFYNNSEVYEVVERVCELRKKWPSSWGKINDQSIGIMTPYADQVFRIRSELRKRRMGGISVERVLNVQGKQFRAIFLSTVRTRRTCTPSVNSVMGSQTDDADFGFLSNSKLLNTAITRAQSLVAVVGDPVALCSIGRCRKVWERFIDICNQNRSLFGITWSCLRSQLDGVELKRSYVLNPLAPEFVPRSLQPESYLRKQAINITNAAHQNMQGAPQGPQMPSTYGMPGYGVLNPAGPNPAISSQQTHVAAHHSPMQGRPMGPPNQGYNLGGPQQVQTNQQQQFSPYLIWPPTQQSGPLIRPNYAPQQQNPQQPPPQQLTQNPNASLWGPPPQTNPWGVIPKPMVNPNIRPTSQPQPPQNQSMNMNMSNMAMRPPAPPAPPLQQQQLQPIRNPQDLSYLSKFVYQNTTPYNNQNHVVLNQIRNQMPNGPASPAMATGHDMVSTLQRVTHAPNSNAMTQPYINSGQQALMSKEKEFQFLNNVHNIPLNMTSNQHQQSIIPPSVNVLPPPSVQNSSASHPMLQLQEYNYLLPHNMSFYEMALEPKEFQYKWYLRLLEVQGQDSANKFTELLRQVMMSTNSSNSNVNNIRQSNAGKNVLLHQQQNINPSPAARGGLPASGAVVNNPTVPTPDTNINFNQQIDLVFNSLMNGNEISQPILRDLLGMVGTASAPAVPNPVLPKDPQTQHLPPNNSFLNCSNDLALSSRVESIPLYRRQVVGNGTVGACSTTSSSSNTQSCASSTPELSQDSSNSSANRNTMNIMESLFHPNNLNNYGNFHSVQKMLYGYQIKNDDDSDILIGARPMNPQMPSQQQQQHPHQQHHVIQHKQPQPQHHTTSQQINHNSNTGNTTYASVLSQGNVPPEQNHDLKRNQPQFNRNSVPDEQDPFAAIRELGERSNGYYNYFQ